MDPPPAPIVWMSRAGRRIGKPATCRCAGSGTPLHEADVGARAAHVEGHRIRELARGRDRGRGSYAARRSRQQQRGGTSRASPTATSAPADVMTNVSRDTGDPLEIRPHAGRSAFTTVVTMRSYSRNSARPRPRRSHRALVAECGRDRLFRGSLRSAWSRHTATAPTAAGSAEAGRPRVGVRCRPRRVVRRPRTATYGGRGGQGGRRTDRTATVGADARSR